ncbi:MAG: hypothetical protein V3W11_06410 [bacterium]
MAGTAKIFLSVRGRYDYTVATVEGIVKNAGEAVDLCIFDDRSEGVDGARLWQLYGELRRRGELSLLVVNTERTTGRYPWGKPVMLSQFAKLMELESFRAGTDLAAIIDNDVELRPNWLASTRRTLELAERQWPGRVAVASPIHDTVHPVVEEVTLASGVGVLLKLNLGAAVWVFRPDFFNRYGLPDLRYAGHGAEDWYYEGIFKTKKHLIVVLAEPLAFHAGAGDSARKAFHGKRSY